MEKPGRDLERLVELLESRFAKDDTVKVQSPQRLRDKDTNRLREHDVVVTVTHQHHTIIIAFECRDRSRKIGVGEVEAFNQKCIATGVHKGVMVSTKGFQNSARVKAKEYGIRCLDIEEAAQFDWIQMGSMPRHERTVTGQEFTLIPVKNPEKKPQKITLIDANKNPVPYDVMSANVVQQIDRIVPFESGAGVYRGRIVFQAPGFAIRNDETGEEIPLKQINAAIEVTVIVTERPVQLVAYKDKDQNTDISQVAKVTLEHEGPLAGDLLFVHDPKKGTEILFVKKPTDQPERKA